MILITQLLYINPGQETIFNEFERIATSRLSKYNGKLLFRIRPTENNIIEHHIDTPYEIHLIEFNSQQDIDGFLTDEERKKNLHLKEQSIKTSIVIQGKKI
jgi:uncharacterized protein (DUF1330 family)